MQGPVDSWEDLQIEVVEVVVVTMPFVGHLDRPYSCWVVIAGRIGVPVAVTAGTPVEAYVVVGCLRSVEAGLQDFAFLHLFVAEM